MAGRQEQRAGTEVLPQPHSIAAQQVPAPASAHALQSPSVLGLRMGGGRTSQGGPGLVCTLHPAHPPFSQILFRFWQKILFEKQQ